MAELISFFGIENFPGMGFAKSSPEEPGKKDWEAIYVS